MPAKLDAALDAVRRGFTIFPIAPDSKVPLLKENWLQIATTDERQIRQWWADAPNANVAGLTGDKLVFDIDPRNGGLDTLEALKTVETFPPTARTETAGAGAHVIYQAPDGHPVKGGTNKAGPGVDIKARGGYILLPGSTINGKAYRWTNERPIARAPQWAVDMCQQARTRTDVAGKRLLEEDAEALQLAERWMFDRAPRAEYGEIDDTTYKVAARLYDFGISGDTAFDLMVDWNETHCSPPQDHERLAVVVESAGRNRDKAIGSAHPLAPGFEAVEIDESRAPTTSIVPTSPKSTDGMQLEGYYDAAAKALSSQAEPLIKGVLDRAAMSIVYGESNTGKTFVAVDMGFHIAASMTWAGRRTRPGCVVYVAAEGGVGVYKRLAALRKHYPDVADIPFFIIKFPVDLLHGPEHAKELVKLCREAVERSGYELELIVIDTLSRAMSGGDENSSTDMGAMVKSFDALREVLGAHLMVIHHSGKDRARGARGHSLLRAATDTEIEIERGKITVTKQRDMDGEFKQHFRLKTVNIGADSEGAHVTSCIVELISGHAAGPVVVPATGDEETLITQLRDRIRRTGEPHFGAQFVRETYLELAWSRGSSDPAIYKVLQTLQTKGLVKKLQAGQYVIEDTPTLQKTPN